MAVNSRLSFAFQNINRSVHSAPNPKQRMIKINFTSLKSNLLSDS